MDTRITYNSDGVEIEEKSKSKGHYVLTLTDITRRGALQMEGRVAYLRDLRSATPSGTRAWHQLNDEATELLRRFNGTFASWQGEVDNILPTVGRSVVAQRLSNTTTYTGTITKVALGTSSSTPANGDTQLGAEVYRNNAASLTYANNIAYVSGFYTAAETNGTYNEVGFFIDGAAGANTGQLWSHALIGVSKSSIQTFTVDGIFTIA